ncbi:hypothetical protein BC829DRAFT_389898, partial [Chytridium lagenaria]
MVQVASCSREDAIDFLTKFLQEAFELKPRHVYGLTVKGDHLLKDINAGRVPSDEAASSGVKSVTAIVWAFGNGAYLPKRCLEINPMLDLPTARKAAPWVRHPGSAVSNLFSFTLALSVASSFASMGWINSAGSALVETPGSSHSAVKDAKSGVMARWSVEFDMLMKKMGTIRGRARRVFHHSLSTAALMIRRPRQTETRSTRVEEWSEIFIYHCQGCDCYGCFSRCSCTRHEVQQHLWSIHRLTEEGVGGYSSYRRLQSQLLGTPCLFPPVCKVHVLRGESILLEDVHAFRTAYSNSLVIPGQALSPDTQPDKDPNPLMIPHAMALYLKYVVNDAPFELNIVIGIRKSIEAVITQTSQYMQHIDPDSIAVEEKIDPSKVLLDSGAETLAKFPKALPGIVASMFDSAEHHIFHLMANDSVPKFIKTKMYGDIMTELFVSGRDTDTLAGIGNANADEGPVVRRKSSLNATTGFTLERKGNAAIDQKSEGRDVGIDETMGVPEVKEEGTNAIVPTESDADGKELVEKLQQLKASVTGLTAATDGDRMPASTDSRQDV